MTGEMMFVIVIAVLGCLVAVFGAATGDPWILVTGFFIMPIAFQCQKIYKRKRSSS